MRYLLIILVAWLPLLAAAVEFDEHTRTMVLGNAVQVLEDPGGQASIQDVSSAAMAAAFRPLQADALNAGFSSSAFWLKVELLYRPQNLAIHRDWLLDVAYPPLDYVDLYLPDASGQLQLAVRTGDMLPFASRQIRQNSYLFALPLHPGEAMTLYLRVAGHGSIQVPLNLWSSHAFLEMQPSRIYVWGLSYGVLFGLLVYNLFIYFGVRDRSYLYYLMYIASFGFYQVSVNGTGVEFLWPNSPWWTNAATPFLVSASVFFACQFSRTFLQTPRLGEWVDWLLRLVMGAAVGVMVLSLLPDCTIALRLVTALVMLFAVVILSAGIVALKKGVSLARYFVVAWSIFLLGSLIHGLMLIGYLPNTVFTLYIWQICSALEVALLSLALAARINLMRAQQAQTLLEAGQALEQLNLELATSNRLKDEFLATLTHELRTPMNGVIGSLELMETVELSEELAQYQQTAAGSAQDMMGMINGILTLTELQAGRLHAEQQPFSVARLFAQLHRQFLPAAQAKGLALLVAREAQLPDDLLGDAARLRQCLECLLDNAIKFTREGSIQLRAGAEYGPNGDAWLLLDVIDSGIGFDCKHASTLYQCFFQVDGSMTREHGGLGIGLAICRQLIELQGGQLSHQSMPGQGSRFTLRLPLRFGQYVSLPLKQNAIN
jgi:signal transduction histidine kinase